MHPILFEIGPIAVRSYGLFVALGFFAAFFLMYREARRRSFYPDKILDIELLILIAGIVGARALHVLVNPGFYAGHPADIFFVWRGGLAFYGGMICAIGVSWIFIVKMKMPFYRTVDFIAPYLALGHAIGRIGCFLNGCCFGKIAVNPLLGMAFPGDTVLRYPTQLYSSLGLLCIFLILKTAEIRPHFAGFVFSLYVLLYSAMRFSIDFLRGDNPTYALGLTVSQYISIAFFMFSIIAMTIARKYGRTKLPGR